INAPSFAEARIAFAGEELLIDTSGFVEPAAGGPPQYVQSAIFNEKTLTAPGRAPPAAAGSAAIGLGHYDPAAISFENQHLTAVRPGHSDHGGSDDWSVERRNVGAHVARASARHRCPRRPGDLWALRGGAESCRGRS